MDQLFDRRRQPGGQPGVDVSRLFKEEACRTCEGPMKIGRFQRDDQRVGEKIGLLGGEVVDAAALVGGQSEAEASQGDDLVTEAVEHVDRLPSTTSCEARPDVQCIQPTHTY